jgi:predicted MFS family arabinose efflux permease
MVLMLKTAPYPPGEALTPAGSIASVLRNRQVRPLLLGIALASISYSSLLTFVVIYISNITSISNPGSYFLYFGLAGIAANLCAGYLSDRLGRSAVAWPALILLGLGNLALAFAPIAPVLVLISSVLAGIGVYGSMLVLIAWLIDTVGENVRATVLSLQENTIDLSFAAGTLFFGMAGSRFGFQAAFAAAGAMLLAPALLLLAAGKKSPVANTYTGSGT